MIWLKPRSRYFKIPDRNSGDAAVFDPAFHGRGNLNRFHPDRSTSLLDLDTHGNFNFGVGVVLNFYCKVPATWKLDREISDAVLDLGLLE